MQAYKKKALCQEEKRKVQENERVQKKQKIEQEFQEKREDLFSKIKVGSQFNRGTDTYTVTEIESIDKINFKYFRGKETLSVSELFSGVTNFEKQQLEAIAILKAFVPSQNQK